MNPSSALTTATAAKRSFHGHFVFQDREAGIFYQAYESEFQAYLQRAFDVDVVTQPILSTHALMYHTHTHAHIHALSFSMNLNHHSSC